jgi:hypothetical protein
MRRQSTTEEILIARYAAPVTYLAHTCVAPVTYLVHTCVAPVTYVVHVWHKIETLALTKLLKPFQRLPA